MGAATPFVVGAIGLAQYQQQGAIGRYNQDIANRNALVKEQEAEILDNKLNLELAQFDKSFKKLQGSQKVRTLKSGAEFSGTARNIALSNLYEAEIEKDIRRYNTEIGKARKFEEANFARISGEVARQQSKLAQLGTLTTVGTSLLTMGNYNA
tara:strand:- start:572 stop:1030 length:459 start_codon:yes stop_codon:yes gene_type:complete